MRHALVIIGHGYKISQSEFGNFKKPKTIYLPVQLLFPFGHDCGCQMSEMQLGVSDVLLFQWFL